MKKNIWIDGYEANVPQRVGSGQVAFELLKNIERQDRENDYTVLLPRKPMGDLPEEREGWKYKILWPGKLWTRLTIPAYYKITKQKPDIIFSPTHYTPVFTKAKIVPVIFDLSFLHFPEMFKKDDLFKLTNWTKETVGKSSQIITISDSTKKDLIKSYGLAPGKITVAYPGFNEEIFKPQTDKEEIEKIKSEYGISGDYIIYIGTIQPRKNLIRLVRAVSKIEGLKLVIAGKIKGLGKQGWMNEEILNEPKRLKIGDRVIFTDFVPTEKLPCLLAGAKAFTLVSLWEGFGIPVVEAMACGIPVIVSNVSSLPEVAGDAGIQVNPESETQIEQAIRLLVTDKKLQQRLAKKALGQSKKFSWAKMAEETVEVLNGV
jgi:glycosyltransferase involved in cell wall biosynthesis